MKTETKRRWFGKAPPAERERVRVVDARGGLSLVAVLTGVLVAFGATLLLSALVGGILAETGVDAGEVAEQGPTDVGLGVGIAMIGAFFLSYLWGGYTAGRMGRGAGAINGLLVPIVAAIIGAIVVAVVNQYDMTANLNLPFTEGRLSADEQATLYDWGETVGLGMIIAMFLGGILGGILGTRWHTRLERRTLDEHAAEREATIAESREAEMERERERRREAEAARQREIDLRQREAAVSRTSGRPEAPTR
jgi:hypothetical protein